MDFATDKECSERRRELIDAGIIRPTEFNAQEERKKLIGRGVISPMVINNKPNFIELPRPKKHFGREYGEYSPKKIKTDEEYNRRKIVYFRIVQEIIYSREKCGLEFSGPLNGKW